jgi:D-glycero-D-manno-heptose 1,7-bisphosphate phosphatase
MSLIILDRDGVINQASATMIKSPADWVPIEGSLEAIARLNQAGYRVVVITHQPGIYQGVLDVETLTKIHSKMRRMLAQVGGKIEAILYCPPHSRDDHCSCWQPLDGALAELENRLRIDLSKIPVVGSTSTHVQSAIAVGARPIIVRTGNTEHAVTEALPSGIEVYDDLASVTAWLLDVQF